MNIFQEEADDVPLREPGKIHITFTPRVFPTPTRESLAPEEEAVCEELFHHTLLCQSSHDLIRVLFALKQLRVIDAVRNRHLSATGYLGLSK